MKGTRYLLRPVFFVRAAGFARAADFRAAAFFAGAFFAGFFLTAAFRAGALFWAGFRAGFGGVAFVAAVFVAAVDPRTGLADGSWCIRITSKPSCVAR